MKTGLFSLFVILISITIKGQDQWVARSNLPLGRWGAVSFVIDDYGYVGTGVHALSLNDLWRYDPRSDTWKEMASLPSLKRYECFSFVIDGLAYIGAGIDSTYHANPEFWEYNPTTNQWNQKGDIPNVSFAQGTTVGLSIDNRGFFLAIFNESNFYEYIPEDDHWIERKNFPGEISMHPAGFSIGSSGYIVSGYGLYVGLTSECWQYSSEEDRWTREANLPGTIRSEAVGFSIGDCGYVALGTTMGGILVNDAWEFNQLTGSWRQISDPGYRAFYAIGMSINGKGYVGTGISDNEAHFFHEYTPATTSVTQQDFSQDLSIYPNPTSGFLKVTGLGHTIFDYTIYSLLGEQIRQENGFTGLIRVHDLPSGTYLIELKTSRYSYHRKFVKR